MPLPKTVTAQDFIKAIPDKAITALEFEEFAHVTVELRMLFARARQEARREALKEMDETVRDVIAADNQLIALYSGGKVNIKGSAERLFKLRQEYQQDPSK